MNYLLVEDNILFANIDGNFIEVSSIEITVDGGSTHLDPGDLWVIINTIDGEQYTWGTDIEGATVDILQEIVSNSVEYGQGF